MPYSQKYALVQFFQHVTENDVFPMTDWPLHITLADVFAVDMTEELLSDLKQHLDTFTYIVTYVKGEGTLGTTDVWLLDNTSELQALHDRLIHILEKHGAVFNSPAFTHNGFIPHITKQAGSDLQIGRKISIDVISLVDMFPDQNWKNRKVAKIFRPAS